MYKPNCGKLAYLAMLKSCKKSSHPDREADDFQNLMGTSLFKDNLW